MLGSAPKGAHGSHCPCAPVGPLLFCHPWGCHSILNVDVLRVFFYSRSFCHIIIF